MAISQLDGPSVPGTRSGADRPSPITLDMTRSMAEALDALAEALDAPVTDVLSQAVGLLMVAVEAQGRAQRICLVDDDLNTVTEIVDFGIPGEEFETMTWPSA